MKKAKGSEEEKKVFDADVHKNILNDNTVYKRESLAGSFIHFFFFHVVIFQAAYGQQQTLTRFSFSLFFFLFKRTFPYVQGIGPQMDPVTTRWVRGSRARLQAKEGWEKRKEEK